MEERKAPDRTERIEQREIDPSAYSLSSSAKMIDESFEETNEIQSWTGGNTDFSDLDDDEGFYSMKLNPTQTMKNDKIIFLKKSY